MTAKWTWRTVGGLCGLLALILGALLAQHQAALSAGTLSPLSPSVAFWLSWLVGALGLAATALPSVFGQSSLAPPGITETRVVREATREAVVDVISDPHHPIRMELEKQTRP